MVSSYVESQYWRWARVEVAERLCSRKAADSETKIFPLMRDASWGVMARGSMTLGEGWENLLDSAPETENRTDVSLRLGGIGVYLEHGVGQCRNACLWPGRSLAGEGLWPADRCKPVVPGPGWLPLCQ